MMQIFVEYFWALDKNVNIVKIVGRFTRFIDDNIQYL